MHLIKGPYVLVWYFSLHASFYILFFLWTWSFSMPISIMTSPRYYNAIHFLTDLNENGTANIKFKIKDILFMRIFWFSHFLWGHPIGWVLSGTHLSHTLGYFFNTKNKKIIIVFTQIGENQGQSLSSSPNLDPH